jgi:hypothetical protein
LSSGTWCSRLRNSSPEKQTLPLMNADKRGFLIKTHGALPRATAFRD